jgi:hypothetical protein
MRYTLYIVLTLSVLVVFSGCRKPRKFVRTKQQQQRVADAILTAEPAPKWKSGANFMEKVELLGVDITPENPSPGQKVTIHFYWKVLDLLPQDGDWMIFVHVEGPNEDGKLARVIADHYGVEDGPGGAGLYPPKEWKKGEIIKDSKTIDLVDPRGKKLGPGPVKVLLGFFDMEAYKKNQENRRLVLTNADSLVHDGQNRVEAATFQVGGGKAVKKAAYTPPKLQVRSAVSPITIDGKMDELAWRGAVTTAPFRRPDGKRLGMDMRTQLKVLHDDSAVYFGFIVSDKEGVSTYVNRDDTLWKQDVVEIYLDPDGDGRNYLELQVSPKNVIFDALFKSHRSPKWEEAKSWNLAGVTTAVYQGELPGRAKVTGWTVEVRIPFSGLQKLGGTKPAPNAEWKANFFRIEQPGDMAHLASWSAVSDTSQADFHNLKRAGTLQFVQTPEAIRNRVLRSAKVGAQKPSPSKAEKPRLKQAISAPTQPKQAAPQPKPGVGSKTNSAPTAVTPLSPTNP